MKYNKLLLIWISVIVTAQVSCKNITYSVIVNDIGNGYIGVLIDDISTPFVLAASTDTPYIFKGVAPAATKGYSYAKINYSGHFEKESSLRSPIIRDSLNEFYGRSSSALNSIPILPKLFDPLSSIHRIDTHIHQDDYIPTFFFYGNEAGIKEMHSNILLNTKVELNLTYIGSNHVKNLGGIKIKLAGRSTRMSLKGSYKINLGKGNDLYGFQKIKLRSLVTDPSYLREKLSSDLIRSFGLAGSGFSYARVFIDNKPYGLFGVQEDLENPWLVNEFNNGDKNYSQGTLYSGNFNASLELLADDKSLYPKEDGGVFDQSSYQIKEVSSKNGEKLSSDFQQLINFTKFLATKPTVLSVAVWNQKIDTDSVLRSLALEVIIGNNDGYIASHTNYFLYSDLNQNGRLIFIPSDMDFTFGSGFKNYCNETIQGNYDKFPYFNPSLPLLRILEVPEFKLTFDSLAEMIKDDVAWDKSITRDYIALPESTKIKTDLDLVIKNENMNPDVFFDYFGRVLHNNVSFEKAINGTINRPSIMGLKQWISKSAEAYQSRSLLS